jgi:hypothetical protein
MIKMGGNTLYTFKKFELRDLTLWELNPRLDETDANDLVIAMLNNQGEKLYRLAKDIVNNGLIEPIAVLMDNNINLVKEGNRRIVSLKILENPNIINNYIEKNVDDNLKNKFWKLSKVIKTKNLFNEIMARVYEREYEDELDSYIASRHLGENKGIGVVTWNSNQKSRWNILQGYSQPVTQFLNFLKFNNILTLYEINGVTKTNWDRILTTRLFQDYLGIKRINNSLTSVPISDNLKLKYKIIASNLKNKTVKIVYDDEARKEFLTKIDTIYNEKLNKAQTVQDNFLRNEPSSSLIIIPSEPQGNVSSNNYDNSKKIETSLNSLKSNLDNKSVSIPYDNFKIDDGNKNPISKKNFFANLTLHGVADIPDNKGIISVAKEIIKISNQDAYKYYPIASTFLMRSLIEQSFIYYLKKINPTAKILKESNGCPKLENLIKYYISNHNIIFGDEKVVSRSLLSFFDNSGTKEYMDMVIHNPHLVSANSNTLDNIVESGLFSVISFILNDK